MQKGNKIWSRKDPENIGKNWGSEIELGEFLYGFVRLVKPEKCLEIGTFEGDGAIAIGNGLFDNKLGKLLTVDIEDFGQKNNIKNEQLESVVDCEIYNGKFSHEFMEESKCDFIFIDDGHEYHEVVRDLEVAHKLCVQGGYILGHDVGAIKTVKQAYNDFLIKYQNQYENLVLFSYAGLFILHKK
jgi:predicted O-methyltransferase YrrM